MLHLPDIQTERTRGKYSETRQAGDLLGQLPCIANLFFTGGRPGVTIAAIAIGGLVVAAVVRPLGGMAVGTIRCLARCVVALLPAQLFVDGLLSQPEDLPDSVMKPLGFLD